MKGFGYMCEICKGMVFETIEAKLLHQNICKQRRIEMEQKTAEARNRKLDLIVCEKHLKMRKAGEWIDAPSFIKVMVRHGINEIRFLEWECPECQQANKKNRQ